MASTSSRLLQLLSVLQTRRFWPGAELADRLAVSDRTLRRDIERLRLLGYPVEARRGVDGGYQLAAGATLPPLILDDEEAVALGVGLHAAMQGATVTGVAEASVRALAKVAKVMPPALRRQVDALSAMTVPASWGGPGPSIEPALLVAVAQACRDEERLEFAYTTRDGEASRRNVEPYRLVLLGRRWYLVAFDLSRFDWRSFRVDRMAEPQSSGDRCIPREPPGGDAAAFVRSGIENMPAPIVVEALVHADAAAVRSRIGAWASSVEEAGAGRCVVRISAESPDWAVIALGATDAEFEIRGPSELAVHLRSWSGRFARAAATAPAGRPGGSR